MNLQDIKKGNLLFYQKYIIKVKTIASHLTSVEKPINNKDMTLYLMGGLGSHYRSFKTNI